MKRNVILMVACAVLGGLVIYFQFFRKKASTQQETFVTTGGMQNLGAVEYDLIEQPPVALDSHELLGAPDFADLVDSGDHAQAIQAVSHSTRPLERLQTLSDSYIPRVASKVVPFSSAAAKPLVHSFSVNVPRVNLKGKLYEMNLSEAVRGSVPINYDPNVAVISKSRYGPSDAYSSGLFTPVFDSLYSKLSGSYRNMPLYISSSGQAGGLGGNATEIIMDI